MEMALSVATALVGGVAAFFIVENLLKWVSIARIRARVGERSQRYVQPWLGASELPTFGGRLEKWLRTKSWGQELLVLIDAAVLNISAGMFIQRLLLFLLLSTAFILLISRSLVITVSFNVLIVLGIYFWLQQRAGQRTMRFSSQLPEALKSIASAMKAGLSIVQAFDEVSRRGDSPIKEELQQVVMDVSVGFDLEEALYRLRHRMPLEDLDAIMASILIQRRSGGNLAELLSDMALMIEADVKLRNELAVLTSQARLSGQIVGLMPVAIFLFMLVVNPGFVIPLFHHPLGYVILVTVVILIVLGFATMSRLSRVEM